MCKQDKSWCIIRHSSLADSGMIGYPFSIESHPWIGSTILMRKEAIKIMRVLRKIGYLTALNSVLLPLIAISMYRYNKQDGKKEKKE